MQNIANAGIGYALPFPLHAAVFTLQIIEDAFHPQQLYRPFNTAANQWSGFSSFKNLST
jgi:hypothetical protein